MNNNYDKYNNPKKAEPEKPKRAFIKVGTKPDGLTTKEFYYFCMVYSHWKRDKLFFRPYWKIAAFTGDSEKSIMKTFKRIVEKGWLIKNKKFGRTRSYKVNTNHNKFWDVSASITNNFVACYSNWNMMELTHLEYIIYCQLIGNHSEGHRVPYKKLAKQHNVSERMIKKVFKTLKDKRLIRRTPGLEIRLEPSDAKSLLRSNEYSRIKGAINNYKQRKEMEKRRKNASSINLSGSGYVSN